MIKKNFYYLWTTGRGLYVLLAILFLGIFVSPILIANGIVPDLLIEGIFALILIAGVFSTPCLPILRLLLLGIVVSAVMARLLVKFTHFDHTVEGVDNVLAVISLMAFSALIIKHFLLDNVSLQYRIPAAVAVYLIFGVLWARIYELVYLLNPAAFSSTEKLHPFALIYFSFVTLMTVGYGDIVPLSVSARSLAILEGIVGQLYLVILISTLVSEFSAIKVRTTKELN
jgi:hypothetical protein